MPTHCGEQWLEASLASVAAEATEGIEILLIDSSPTNATLDIARRYSDRLSLRVLERRDLQMWHTKTNYGVEIATSEYICWLHQDDIWFPGRAAAARAWIDTAPDVSLHLAPGAIVDRHGRKLGIWRCPLPAGVALHPALVIDRLLVQNFISAPAPIFRKDAWLACGGLDEELWYTADWDIWLKLAASGSICYHDSVTTGFRIHGASLTATGSRDSAAFANQMRIVLDRHSHGPGNRLNPIDPVAHASITVNTALALAAAGDFGGVSRALSEVLRLGPSGIYRYLRDSRIVERLTPRMMAKMSGVF